MRILSLLSVDLSLSNGAKGLYFWVCVGFICIFTWCIQAAKALASLLICVGLHKASLLYDVISVTNAPSSQAKGTKSTSFLTRKERSGLSTLGLRRCKIPCARSNIKNEMH